MMQQQQQPQQQPQPQAKQSAMSKLVGLIKEEASSLPKRAKQRLQAGSNASETSSQGRAAEEQDEAVRGDSVQQGLLSHAALLRFCQPGVGRRPCASCQPEDDGCLHWNLGSLLAQQQQQAAAVAAAAGTGEVGGGSGLSSREQGRILAMAFNPMAPIAQRLHDLAGGENELGFDASDEAYEMLNLATEFLHQLCANHLAPLLPLIFKGSSATLIGSWAQESALRAARPVLDYVIGLPAWVRSNKLCLCDTAGLAQTVVRPSPSGWLPFETSVHQALVCGIERVVANTAAAVLGDSAGPVRPDSGRNVSCNAGAADSSAAAPVWWSPKRVSLPVLCHTSQGAVRPVTLRLLFGVPCCLLAGDGGGGGSDGDGDGSARRLFGHLLLGFSQPRLLCLAKAEQAALLSGAGGPDHPSLRILRIVKFLLGVGQQLALDRKEVSRADPQLSFLASCAVREALRKFEADDGTAYMRANFARRLEETLDQLLDKSRPIGYFGPPDWSFASVSKRPLPPSTIALLGCVRSRTARHGDGLLELLLQYFKAKEASQATDSKLLAKIDKAVKAVMAGDEK